MSGTKKNVGLKATGIDFTNQSIVYTVEFVGDSDVVSGVVFCGDDIKDKDLILKPTFIDIKNMEVVFTPVNVTPHFYQAIHNKTIRNLSELITESKNIYSIGEIVGFISK